MTLIADVALPKVVTGTIELGVALATPVTSDVVGDLHTFFLEFIATADRGAFVVADKPPHAAKLRVLSDHLGNAGFLLRCEAHNLDPRFALVLRNLCVMFSKVTHDVLQLHVQMLGIRPYRIAPIDPTNLADRYPPLTKHLHFRLQRDADGPYRGPRYVEIMFADVVSDELTDEIIAWLNTWASVAQGGYSSSEEELRSGNCAIFDAVPDLREPGTIEVPIAMFGAPAVAWNGLLNLCESINTELTRVIGVEIT